MAPNIIVRKVEKAAAVQKAGRSNQKTKSSKGPKETATQQAAAQQVTTGLGAAVDAAEPPRTFEFVHETPSVPRIKRPYTPREKPPVFPPYPYGPTDPDRQGVGFRTERMEDGEDTVGAEEDTVGPKDVANLPAAYPKYPDRTYYPDGSQCS